MLEHEPNNMENETRFVAPEAGESSFVSGQTVKVERRGTHNVEEWIYIGLNTQGEAMVQNKTGTAEKAVSLSRLREWQGKEISADSKPIQAESTEAGAERRSNFKHGEKVKVRNRHTGLIEDDWKFLFIVPESNPPVAVVQRPDGTKHREVELSDLEGWQSES